MVNKDWIYKYFSEDQLKDIQQAVEYVERKTVGEVVLSFRYKRTLGEKLYTPHELAVKDFETLGVANTKEKTGILVFILFEEHYFDILADEGIFKKIPDTLWNDVEKQLKKEFKKGNYMPGVIHLIEAMTEILVKEFPTRAGAEGDDEISNEIVIN
jgi:uncharacterized membrane protein